MPIANTTQELITNFLTNGPELEIALALRLSAKLGNIASYEDVQNLLLHDDLEICLQAVDALCEREEKQVTELLIEALERHPSPDLKVKALEALIKRGDDSALEKIRYWITHRPDGMDEDSASGWDDYWDMQLMAIEAMGKRHYAKGLPDLLSLLDQDENQGIEIELCMAIANCCDDGQHELFLRLENASERRQRRIVTALVKSDLPKTAVFIYKAIQRVTDELKAPLIEALAARNATEYLIDVLPLILSDCEPLQHAALRSALILGQQKGRESLTVLSSYAPLDLLNTGNIKTQQWVLKLLPLWPLDDEATQIIQVRLLELWADADVELCYSILAYWEEIQHPDLASMVTELIDNNLRNSSDLPVLLSFLSRTINDTDAAHWETWVGWINAIEDVAALNVLLKVMHERVALIGSNDIPDWLVELHWPVVQEETNQDDTQVALATNAVKEQLIPVTSLDAQEPPPAAKMIPTPAELDDYQQYGANKTGNQSTLASIASTQVQENLYPATEREETLRELINSVPEDMSDFAEIASGHLDNANTLGSSKRKIAAMPKQSPEVLKVQSLRYLPFTQVTNRLIEQVVSEQDVTALAEALTVLGDIWRTMSSSLINENHLSTIAQQAYSTYPAVRLAAIRALHSFRHPDSWPVLHEALADEEDYIVIAACKALLTLYTEPYPSHYVCKKDLDAADLIEGIQLMAQSDNPSVQQTAYNTLVGLKAEDTLQLLIKMGMQEERFHLEFSAKALTAYPDEEVASILEEGFVLAAEKEKNLWMQLWLRWIENK